jgi:hypothetical protein
MKMQSLSCIRQVRYILLPVCFFLTSMAFAQKNPLKNLPVIISSIDSFNHKLPVEKLYLQLDKPYYTTQDTIWLKAYLFNNTTHYYSALSGLLYVELINDSSKVVQRISLRVKYGLGWGQIALNILSLEEGSYTIRAYTNWMQNFGSNYLFNKRIYIGNSLQNLLVKESYTLTDKNNGKDLKLLIQLTKPGKQPLIMRDMLMKIMTKKRTLYSGIATTSIDGIIENDFMLPKQPGNFFSILLEDKQDNKFKADIPLIIHDPQYVDVQFMPEGGHLIAGLTSWVGFKAIADDGLATDIQGTIINSKNEQICTFKSLHKGMGAFNFTPLAGETYKAIIDLPGSKKKDYVLPQVQNSGIVLHVTNDDTKDSLSISVYISESLINGQMYHLLGLSRGVVCYGANMTANKKEINIKIAKKLFPSGILHFTLFNSDQIPIVERLTFINHNDNLNITLNTDKPYYLAYDSIGMYIKVTDKDNRPVSASLSLSVTNDAQIKVDSVGNILTNIFLSSDLQGYIEEPMYYFDLHNPLSAKALDNLLLTQGWVDYKWENILKPMKEPLYAPEPAFTVTGKITNWLNKPANNAKVTLISTGKYRMYKDTVSNAKGKFIFQNFPIADTAAFVIQTIAAKGKSAGMGISVNEFTPASGAINYQTPIIPWYVNSDAISFNYISNNIARQNEIDNKLYGAGSKVLKEVRITDKKIIKGSYNLNGPGEADQILDEHEIEKEKKITLLELLYKRVKGFTVSDFPAHSGNLSFTMYTKEVRILMDGVELDRSLGGQFPGGRFEYINNFLKEYTAEDVKGIEVMHSGKYNSKYDLEFLPPSIYKDPKFPIILDWAYIEITTRSGHGIFTKPTPGVIIYNPLPITQPKQFYNPKYIVKTTVNTSDIRSTIYWEPNIITNRQGEANVSFYAGGQYSQYTIIMQGADMFGAIGFKTMKIKIAK